jgi:hypothetical protein
MKKFFILLTAVLMTVCFQSCSDDKYTVWTETGSYSAWIDSSQPAITDGYYKRLEITNDEWEQISKSLTNEGKHRWSEDEINKWFLGCGFGSSEATKETSWLVTINHGFVVMRDGYLVYMILK